MKIGIAGSMQYVHEMLDIKEKLISIGHEAFTSPLFATYNNVYDKDEIEKIKLYNKNNRDAIKAFWNEMQGQDAILVCNFDKHGIKNYIGGNTLMEIGFAHVLNQKIFYSIQSPKLSIIKQRLNL